jgi:hypothetical protein
MKVKIFFAIALAIASWLKTGVLVVARVEGEDHVEFFVKTHPTWKIIFNDPYRSDVVGEEHEYRSRMDGKGDWLPGTKESSDYLTYCKYRYDIADVEKTEAMIKCRDRQEH